MMGMEAVSNICFVHTRKKIHISLTKPMFVMNIEQALLLIIKNVKLHCATDELGDRPTANEPIFCLLFGRIEVLER